MKPEELLFGTTHEWVHLASDASGAKIATIGISKFAVEALTDLVFIELPKVGALVKAGESFGEIESVKAVSDIYSPVDGEVVEVNNSVSDALEKLGDDPYGEGWLIKVRVTDDASPSGLLDFAAYEKHCAEEEG